MKAALLMVLFALAIPSLATVFRTGNNTVSIPTGQVIDDDLVVTGYDVTIHGTVTGDVVVAGYVVRIDGRVGGDLIVAGRHVTVSGPVGGTLYAISRDIALTAPVAHNVLAASGAMTLDRAATVGRDMSVSGGNVTVESKIGRDLRVNATNLTLASGAVIGGDLIAQVRNHTIAPGAKIAGEQQITRQQRRQSYTAGWFLRQLLAGAMLLAAGLIFIAFAPRLTEETETALRVHPGLSLGVGAVILLVGLPLVLLLLFTIVGIPVALIWTAAYFSGVYLSPIFLAILVGRLVWRRPGGSLYAALAIGIILLVLIRLVPVFGAVVTLGAVLFGLGALAMTLYGRGIHRRGSRNVCPAGSAAAGGLTDSPGRLDAEGDSPR